MPFLGRKTGIKVHICVRSNSLLVGYQSWGIVIKLCARVLLGFSSRSAEFSATARKHTERMPNAAINQWKMQGFGVRDYGATRSE